MVSKILIRWIAIYPVDSAILLNNLGQVINFAPMTSRNVRPIDRATLVCIGSMDYKSAIIPGELDVLRDELCQDRPLNGCSQDFNELAAIAMEEEDITDMPESAQEALTLFAKVLGFAERHAKHSNN